MRKPAATANSGSVSSTDKFLFLKIFENIKFELPVFILLLIFYVTQKSKVTYDIYYVLYAFDYRIGFAPKLFIGSVMSLFTDYKSQAFMDTFFDSIFFAEAVLFAYIAGRLIRKASDETKEITIYLVALFLAIPYSLFVFYPRLVSIDRVNFLFTILALLLINKRIFKWAVPFLLFAALATYQNFTFMYFPVIAILLIYEIYRNNCSKQSIILCIVSYLTLAGFSTYFYLFARIKKTVNLEQLINIYSKKTDYPCDKTLFDVFLIESPIGVFQKYAVPRFESYLHAFKGELVSIVYLIPLIIIFFLIWKNAIKNSTNKFEKFTLFLCLLSPIARLPMFILSNNYMRGRIPVIIVQFCLVFYFLYTGNQAVTKSVKHIGDFFKKNFLLCLLMIAYFALSFLAFRTGEIWATIQKFWQT